MAKFIEVTVAGVKRLINVNIIEEVRPNWDGGSDIYLAFTCPNATEQDCVATKESYSTVKARLLGGGNDGK